MSDSLRPHGLYSPWNSLGHIGVGSLFFLQGIFPTQGSNPGLLHWQAGSLPLTPLGKTQYYLQSIVTWAPLVAQLLKNLPAMNETLVQFLGQEDLLEKE